jgi:hypothetical protein
MDEKMLKARLRADEGICSDGQAVWSCPPDAGIKLAGGDLRATVANKPGTPAIECTHLLGCEAHRGLIP